MTWRNIASSPLEHFSRSDERSEKSGPIVRSESGSAIASSRHAGGEHRRGVHNPWTPRPSPTQPTLAT